MLFSNNMFDCLKVKKWNPYCLRHSSISSDSYFLPEYALKKKVRWSMNSKQGIRYIKRRIGDELKNQILVRNGKYQKRKLKRNHQFIYAQSVNL